MDVTGINLQTASADGAGTAKKNGTSAAVQNRSSDAARSSGATAQVLTNLADTNYIKDQLETIMFSFPPFFPIGSPQRLDLIKGIKGVQDEIKKSPLAPAQKDTLTATKLTDQSTDQEVAAALVDLKQYKDAISPQLTQKADHVQSGTIINVKV